MENLYWSRGAAGKVKWLHLGVLIGAILILYAKVLNAGFMNWDDLDYVFNTKDINSGLGLKQLRNWFTTNYLGNYQPLPVLTYAIDHAIGGPDPRLFHLHNLLWHVAATILLYVFVNRIQGNAWVAFFVALLFAIHPTQTESVSWIASRNKSMKAVFYFAALNSYVAYCRTQKYRQLVWVTVFGVMAYLCRASALALPFALFSVDLWLGRNIISFKEKLPLVLIAIPVAIITLYAQEQGQYLHHHSGFGWSNIILAGYALMKYFINLLFPFNLSLIYPFPAELAAKHYMGFMLALLVMIMMVVFFRKGWFIWAGGIWFFAINLLPVLQLVQFGEMLMADRYLYIACVGIWYPLVYYVFTTLGKKSRGFALAVCLVPVIVFSVLTFMRNDIWKNEINFWTSVIRKFPRSAVAHYSLGAAHLKQGDLNRAEDHMNKAVQAEPMNYKAWRNKGTLHLRKNEVHEALEAFSKSISIYPYSRAYFSRATVYHGMKEFQKAISDVEKVLELEPDNARAYYVKADCEEQLKQPEKALADYNRAIQLDDREPLFLIRRGMLLARTGNATAALQDLDKAIMLRPQDGVAYYYRAGIRFNIGQDPCNDLRKSFSLGYEPAAQVMERTCR